MPFDTLPARLGSANEITQATSGQASQMMLSTAANYHVAPISDIISHGADQISKIIDEFSPLSRSEKEAKISANVTKIRALHLLQSPDPKDHAEGVRLMQELSGHYEDAIDNKTKELRYNILQHQYERVKKGEGDIDKIKGENDIYTGAAGPDAKSGKPTMKLAPSVDGSMGFKSPAGTGMGEVHARFDKYGKQLDQYGRPVADSSSFTDPGYFDSGLSYSPVDPPPDQMS